MDIYCGNNGNILGPDIRAGTNYECLRRGIGGALRQPVDPSYMLPYAPLYDTPRIWCGMDEDNLPAGYDAVGVPPQCLSRGWGIGLAINASRARRGTSRRRKTKKQKTKQRKARRTKTKQRKARRTKTKQRKARRTKTKQRKARRTKTRRRKSRRRTRSRAQAF